MRFKKPKPLKQRSLLREFEHTGSNDIVVIGYQCPKDDTSLFMIGAWFATHRKDHTIIDRLRETINMDSFDMATHPERGDALDHITGNTKFVIALHLNGLQYDLDVTKHGPDWQAEIEKGDVRDGYRKGYRYTRNNGELLDRCISGGASLICQGEQPAFASQGCKVTWMYGGDQPTVYLYEPETSGAVFAGNVPMYLEK